MSEEQKTGVYMSGALSAFPNPEKDFPYVTEQIYDRVKRICDEMGISCYLPSHSLTTPTLGVSHIKVWQIDYNNVVNSSVVVAYIGIPSLGVGAEIEMAREKEIPVILLFEESKQRDLSRLILGSPNVKYNIPFKEPKDIDNQLQTALFLIFSEKNLESVARAEEWTITKLDAMRERLTTIKQEALSVPNFRNLPYKTPIGPGVWSQFGKEWDNNNRVTRGPLDAFIQ